MVEEEELVDIARRIEQLMDQLDSWLRAREADAQAAADYERVQRWRRRRWRLKAHRQGLMGLLTDDTEQ